MSSHSHDLSALRHSHAFGDDGLARRQQALGWVVVITVVTMVGELAAGWWTGSLALLADGWHMGTHALALGGALLAYRLSARARQGTGYAFGGWKIEVLAAYTSGLMLLAVAAWIVVDALAALRMPQPIAYREAIAVAAVGLAVNLVCALLLARGDAQAHAHGHGHGHAHQHGHGHGHGHELEQGEPGAHRVAPAEPGSDARSRADGHAHDHPHGRHGSRRHRPDAPSGSAARGDHNYAAAYVHVIADAFTSVLAIVALAGGLWFGAAWLDPAVALLGAAVIARWAFSVLRHSSQALVDATEDPALCQQVRRLIEADGDAVVADLHLWQVGAQAWCAALSVVADAPRSAADYRQRLAGLQHLRHVTVEVHQCPGAASPT